MDLHTLAKTHPGKAALVPRAVERRQVQTKLARANRTSGFSVKEASGTDAFTKETSLKVLFRCSLTTKQGATKIPESCQSAPIRASRAQTPLLLVNRGTSKHLLANGLGLDFPFQVEIRTTSSLLTSRNEWPGWQTLKQRFELCNFSGAIQVQTVRMSYHLGAMLSTSRTGEESCDDTRDLSPNLSAFAVGPELRDAKGQGVVIRPLKSE